MEYSWLSVIPPFAVLILAFVTHNIMLSLGAGIVLGVGFASKGQLTTALYLVYKDFLEQILDIDKLVVFSFLIVIGAIIALINATGSVQRFSELVTQRLRSSRRTKFTSMALSICLFIDDYLNSLTVGYIMRPLTDRFGVPRAKLAFLVDSMTAPLSIMIPLSSWVAMILTNFGAAGISNNIYENPQIIADPLYAYFFALPFVFYSLIMISNVAYIIARHISYGPMHEHDRVAATTGNLFGGKAPIEHNIPIQSVGKSYLSDFFVPIGTLVSAVIAGISLFGHAQIFNVLLGAATLSLIISVVLARKHQTLELTQLPDIALQGFALMKSAIIIIILAGVFGTLLKNDLQTGKYLSSLIADTIGIGAFPLLLFVISALTALATGTSWGTIALLLPIGLPVALKLSGASTAVPLMDAPYILPCIGAVLSGAVAGDHISPISETTVMAATSSGCYVGDHASTQLWYAIPALLGTGVGFGCYMFITTTNILTFTLAPLACGLTFSIILLEVFNRRWRS